MKKWSLVCFAVVSIVVAAALRESGRRSAAPDHDEERPRHGSGFDPAESVAVFVGVRSFIEDGNLEIVPYAVDDAVDLAYTFAIDQRAQLVRAPRVTLALSDPMPQKMVSRWRLDQLKSAGANVVTAGASDILKLLNHQAAMVGEEGIFIVSFASHGFSNDGSQYLLASNSLFREITTSIPAARVLDLVATSDARRSLILIDTCRERVSKRRTGARDPLSAAPLIRQMSLTEGQVVFYAAAAGQWAYDDEKRQNGVFTGAVLDALQCRAGHDRSGLVTAETLAATVERTVREWIRIHHDPSIRNATQANMDGAARSMPLANCAQPRPPDPPKNLDELYRDEPAAVSVLPPPPPRPLRPLLEACRKEGKDLLRQYGSRNADDFVAAYLSWRGRCVEVLHEVDTRFKSTPSETSKFMSVADFWCATSPSRLLSGKRNLFLETPRAERCSWDLQEAIQIVDGTIIRKSDS